MKAIYITGTAGSGKSLLTSNLLQWYIDHDNFPITLNLDPAVSELPYPPDVDIRDHIDISNIIDTYGLGPNGAIIMAHDLISTKIQDIQLEVDELNPDYILIDTPGQIELFAYRSSGNYFISNFQADSKVTIFIMDGVLVSSPINFVSLSLLSTSINLRLKTSQINVLSKRDLIIDNLENILDWSHSDTTLLEALDKENNQEFSLLSKDVVKIISQNGLNQDLVAVSNLTMNGLIELYSVLSRILNQGEEIEY
ncbi:MAG TPA: ATP/GTP-binding protein [Nitrososphaeraceae archaeon]|nr:ATP/GTP-binding protein [Nitrososphaeraceae archaeon]